MFSGIKAPPFVDYASLRGELYDYIDGTVITDTVILSDGAFKIILENLPKSFINKFPPITLRDMYQTVDIQNLLDIEYKISMYLSGINYIERHPNWVPDEPVTGPQTVTEQVERIVGIVEDFVDDYVYGTDG